MSSNGQSFWDWFNADKFMTVVIACVALVVLSMARDCIQEDMAAGDDRRTKMHESFRLCVKSGAHPLACAKALE